MTPYSLADFARFARKLRTEDGEPFKLAAFQKRLLEAYFRGTRETVIVLPTGNGKTTLLAALALYHMIRVPNASVLLVAAAAEQAAQLFKQARTLIQETPYADVLDVKYGTHRIYHRAPSDRGRSSPAARPPGEIRVIASEVGKQEGAIPTLVLVDELHAHSDLHMYEMLRDKLRKRRHERGCGRMVTISTAGFNLSSPLYTLREHVHTLPTFERHGTYNHAAEPNFEWHEHCLTNEDNLNDLGLVAKANPAPWITKTALAETRNTPTMSPGEWARSACNVWTAGREQPIKPEEWDALYADTSQVADGEDVYLAPSIGHNAAIGIAAPRPDGRVAVRAEIIEALEGQSIRALTEDRIVALCDRYRVVEVHHPLGGYIRSAELLQARGVPVIEAAHSSQRITAASGTFDRLIRGGLLIHDGDPTVRRHVLAAVLKSSETGERYLMEDRSRATIALAMAAHPASAPEDDLKIILPSVGGVG